MLGKTVTDKITGFKGVVTGTVQYITGCNQVLVAPRAKDDGAHVESHWVDEQRVVVDDTVDVVKLENGKTPGFDREPPKR